MVKLTPGKHHERTQTERAGMAVKGRRCTTGAFIDRRVPSLPELLRSNARCKDRLGLLADKRC